MWMEISGTIDRAEHPSSSRRGGGFVLSCVAVACVDYVTFVPTSDTFVPILDSRSSLAADTNTETRGQVDQKISHAFKTLYLRVERKLVHPFPVPFHDELQV